MLERARSNPKIKFLYNATITRWNGMNGVLSGFHFKNSNSTIDSKEYSMDCDGAFIAIG